MAQSPIYMDNHATTRLAPEVLSAMMPYLTEHYGNAASTTHRFGWRAEEAVESARRQVARLIGAAPEEVVFTSGATESNNLALLGMFEDPSRGHLVTAATEHPAVLDVTSRLLQRGHGVAVVPVDEWGRVRPDAVAKAVQEETRLVSLMLANNEVGTLHPLCAVSDRLAELETDVPLHTDAAQAVGHIPVDVGRLGVAMLSLSAHKFHGPKGVGALYVKAGSRPDHALQPIMSGGGHEGRRRPGTLNVAGIVGLGEACEIAGAQLSTHRARVSDLRRRMNEQLVAVIPDIQVHGHPEERLPGNLNVSFAGIDGEALVRDLTDIALSTGSACSSATAAPSPTLLAMGVSAETARASVRFGLGRYNTADEVDDVVAAVAAAVARLRQLSPFAG